MDSMVMGLTWWSARVPAGFPARLERLQWLANQLEMRLLTKGSEAASQGGLTVLSTSSNVMRVEAKYIRDRDGHHHSLGDVGDDLQPGSRACTTLVAGVNDMAPAGLYPVSMKVRYSLPGKVSFSFTFRE